MWRYRTKFQNNNFGEKLNTFKNTQVHLDSFKKYEESGKLMRSFRIFMSRTYTSLRGRLYGHAYPVLNDAQNDFEVLK